MKRSNYQRTPEELEDHASKFWPSDISQQEADISIIPRLLETQDQFISILGVQVGSLENMFNIINSALIPANLFLKHLVVLTDIGGEILKRSNVELTQLIVSGEMTYGWINGIALEPRTYEFKALPEARLSNETLKISGKQLQKRDKVPLTGLQQDAIALLVAGSQATNPKLARIFAQGQVGEYIGRPDKLKRFVRERYIWVSRITNGSKANSLGQIVQQYVRDYLEKKLEHVGVEIKSNGTILDVQHDPSHDTTFDLVLKKREKYVAIEISFQVTTNSVIERKAGQAQARYEKIKNAGHKIAYVLDGAGNFERRNAMKIICDHSDCTVAFSDEELNVLCEFVVNYFGDH